MRSNWPQCWARRLPVAIQRIQTDHGNEFGTDVTWHLRDLGIAHRHISLFAALDVKTSKVIGRVHRRHRAVEFRKFFDAIDAAVPRAGANHLILDNYGTHKTAIIRRWMAKRPRTTCTSLRPMGRG